VIATDASVTSKRLFDYSRQCHVSRWPRTHANALIDDELMAGEGINMSVGH